METVTMSNEEVQLPLSKDEGYLLHFRSLDIPQVARNSGGHVNVDVGHVGESDKHRGD